MDCPFLSTYDNEVECFKDCALYNYKGNGGNCPFKNIAEYKINKLKDIELYSLQDNDLNYIKNSYFEEKSSIL